MTQDSITPGSWRIHLLVTGTVFFTLLLALLLAQLDSLQRQILPSPVAQAIANLNATATNTPLPAIPLASGTPTPPGSAAVVNDGSDTAVAMLPNCAAVPPGWSLTAISSGETVFTLSLRYNISEEKIRLANCLQPGSLLNVSALYLPNPAATPNPTAVCGPPQNWVLYTVRRGDTLFLLATRYGTSMTAVINANCLTTTNIQAGQRLYLPPAAAFPPAASATPRPTLTSTSTATATATGTGTSTQTPTSTVPALPTVSTTPTVTITGTLTSTPSSTPVASATATLGTTPTITTTPAGSPTAGSTPSLTPTATSTSPPIPTASATPTNSPMPTPSATDTAVPTATALVAPSATPTP